MRLIISAIAIFISTISLADYSAECWYVNAKGGLNLREKPNFNSKKIALVPHGTMIDMIEWTDSFSVYYSGGVKYHGRWVKINYNNNYGYIVDDFIAPVVSALTQEMLYFDTDYCKHGYAPPCKTQAELIQDIQADTENVNRKYVKLELVDINDYWKKMPYNKYTIDTTRLETHIKKDTNSYIDTFWLPINNGKDKIVFHDLTGEAYTNVYYLGKIGAINSYLIRYCYEDCYTTFVDTKTGEEHDSLYSYGSPFISPRGTRMIGFDVPFFFGDYAPTFFEVSYIGPDRKIKNKFMLSFKYWTPVVDKSEVYWLSENEVIIKVMPLALYFRNDGLDYRQNLKKIKEHYQYIKLTIL